MLDYDYYVTHTKEYYMLRMNRQSLPKGMYCRIFHDGRGWVRKTRANGNGSIRYIPYSTLDEALAAGIKWGIRKINEISH